MKLISQFKSHCSTNAIRGIVTSPSSIVCFALWQSRRSGFWVFECRWIRSIIPCRAYASLTRNTMQFYADFYAAIVHTPPPPPPSWLYHQFPFFINYPGEFSRWSRPCNYFYIRRRTVNPSRGLNSTRFLSRPSDLQLTRSPFPSRYSPRCLFLQELITRHSRMQLRNNSHSAYYLAAKKSFAKSFASSLFAGE